MADISYEPILRYLQPLELDIFTIDDKFDGWWEGETYDNEGYKSVPKGFLESIAKHVELSPE
jgi:hypothetical protein